jgi:hypothetical protein
MVHGQQNISGTYFHPFGIARAFIFERRYRVSPKKRGIEEMNIKAM